LAFAEKVKSELGVKAMHREIAQAGGTMHCGNRVKLTGVTGANLTVKEMR
jgi:hypothetical protein